MGVLMNGFSLREFLAVDRQGALQFFIDGLVDVVEPGTRSDELLYNASILAHHTQVSCCHEGEDLPCPKSLTCIFEQNILLKDPKRYKEEVEISPEAVASQILLMSGFFKGRMRHRHNINWYRHYGARFYMWASEISAQKKEDSRAEVLRRMALNFSFWAERQYRLDRSLRDKPYLIELKTNGSVN
jgi:hypothetical protein